MYYCLKRSNNKEYSVWFDRKRHGKEGSKESSIEMPIPGVLTNVCYGQSTKSMKVVQFTKHKQNQAMKTLTVNLHKVKVYKT